MKKHIIAIALAAVAGSAMADIKIGIIHPQTGGSAPLGQSSINGSLLAIKEINANGGITVSGKKEKLVPVIVDDESKAERGPQMSQQLISEGVVATIGFVNFAVANPSLKVFQEAGVPLMINASAGGNMASTYQSQPMNYIFRLANNDTIQTDKVTKYILSIGAKRPAIIADDTAYGRFGAKEVTRKLAEKGVTVVTSEQYKLKDVSFDAQVLKVKAAGADFLVLWGIGAEAAGVARTVTKLSMHGIPMASGWGAATPAFVSSTGDASEGTVIPLTLIEADPLTGKQAKFISDYRAEYKVDSIPVASAAIQGYDSIKVLAAAIEQGGTKGADIAAALENLKAEVPGLIKNYKKPYQHGVEHEALTAADSRLGIIKAGVVRVLDSQLAEEKASEAKPAAAAAAETKKSKKK